MYTLQEINKELEIKLELGQGRSNQKNMLISSNHEDELLELLKMENRENKERIRELEIKEKEWIEKGR